MFYLFRYCLSYRPVWVPEQLGCRAYLYLPNSSSWNTLNYARPISDQHLSTASPLIELSHTSLIHSSHLITQVIIKLHQKLDFIFGFIVQVNKWLYAVRASHLALVWMENCLMILTSLIPKLCPLLKSFQPISLFSLSSYWLYTNFWSFAKFCAFWNRGVLFSRFHLRLTDGKT